MAVLFPWPKKLAHKIGTVTEIFLERKVHLLISNARSRLKELMTNLLKKVADLGLADDFLPGAQ